MVFRFLVVAAIFGLAILREPAGLQGRLVLQAAGPDHFALLDWQVRQLSGRAGRIVAALRDERPPPASAELEAVRAYFGLPLAARRPIGAQVEPPIERLVEQVWRAEGLATPSPLASGAEVLFPPVSFTFSQPPKVLIVSPRERIRVAEYALLRPDLDLPASERLEASVATRGLSPLVTPIGGLATYPAMVLDTGSAQQALAAVAHEWAHAYFFFQPLGRAYWSDQEAREINETAAEMAGEEIGARLAGQLGLPVAPPRRGASPRQREFQRELRRTRVEVEQLLQARRIDEAEALMEVRRQELNARGFAIRKLNQAYFAFHGSYGDGPAGDSPIPARLEAVRDASPSLGRFLQQVAAFRNAEDLLAAYRDRQVQPG